MTHVYTSIGVYTHAHTCAHTCTRVHTCMYMHEGGTKMHTVQRHTCTRIHINTHRKEEKKHLVSGLSRLVIIMTLQEGCVRMGKHPLY